MHLDPNDFIALHLLQEGETAEVRPKFRHEEVFVPEADVQADFRQQPGLHVAQSLLTRANPLPLFQFSELVRLHF